MARIDGVNPEEVETYIKKVLESQEKTWGAPLLNHLVYARRPSIFRGQGRCGLVSVPRA
ncbi:hypothetical protein KDW_20230 [Dictyobacter vulcani]|uniref:Uncharacterized protein n=1 Tax=Dictyobacter vulcani TaxID=2607529 RepID=A0A5J4KNH5_9CHLR|nr:hypothetical protein [Dictyobacter vulcani]GER87861.1 hypothetical protein KDW_20230 [Dictyobacter vulcani]